MPVQPRKPEVSIWTSSRETLHALLLEAYNNMRIRAAPLKFAVNSLKFKLVILQGFLYAALLVGQSLIVWRTPKTGAFATMPVSND